MQAIQLPAAEAANSYPTNPLGFAYGSVTGVAQYGHPTGMVITGRCNRYDPAFTAAQANGAEVLAYLDTVERPDSQVCAADTDFYGGDLATTPLWPYPTYGQRSNYQGMHLTDIQVGSAWSDSVVAYVSDLMIEDKVDGVFLDAIGARLWGSLTNWGSWPQVERDKWTQGAVDLVNRLDTVRRQVNPRFIIVTNNVWDDADATVWDGAAQAEAYIDGVCIEHHPYSSQYHKNMAGHAFGNLGHRRVLIIANTTAEATQWATVQGVTHVSDQHGVGGYASVSPPPVGFNRLTDRPKTFGRTTVGTTPSSGMSGDYKRGSKFTLPDKATLLSFSAYLDGTGGAAGSQSMKMVLYRDSGGLPAARLVESNTVTVAAGATGGWVTFTAPATPLDPGAYWIVIHTGSTEGVARNRGGDGGTNWYGNADTFPGAANPFGTGTAGTGTLSVNVSYTVGY
ncbi:MAG: hypothetical protein ACM30G_06410 [Micromonosporaceae bacterium]